MSVTVRSRISVPGNIPSPGVQLTLRVMNRINAGFEPPAFKCTRAVRPPNIDRQGRSAVLLTGDILNGYPLCIRKASAYGGIWNINGIATCIVPNIKL